MTERKPRGRPKGTDLKEDRSTLRTVADLMVLDHTLTPTAAIKKAVPDWTETVVRRLRGKWKPASDALLDDAKSRLALSADQATVALAKEADYEQIRRALSALNELTANYYTRSGGLHSWLQKQDNVIARIAKGLEQSAAMRTIEIAKNNPTMQYIARLQTSPRWIRIIEQHKAVDKMMAEAISFRSR